MAVTNRVTVGLSVTGQTTSDSARQNGKVTASLPAGTLTLTQGTGTNKVLQQCAGDVTLSAGGSATIDLYGTLTDPFGNTINFTKIKSIGMTVTSGSGPAQVGGATNTFDRGLGTSTVTETFMPHYLKTLATATGFSVSNSSTDKLVLTNNGSDTMNIAYHFAGE